MRKFDGRNRPRRGRCHLQCGRIYKDAEMSHAKISCAPWKSLQCGRIYKDAEIGYTGGSEGAFFFLQCGRIYKDAEIGWTAILRD